MKIFRATFVLSMMVFGVIQAETTIEPYNKARDYDAIDKILKDYPYIGNEGVGGCPEGTSMKYVESTQGQWKTDVILVDGEPVGFATYVVHDAKFCTFYLGRKSNISMFGIGKDYHRKGYGEKLLNHVLASIRSQNVPQVILSVRRVNVGARALYEKAGFKSLVPKEHESKFKNLIYELVCPEFDAEKLPKGNVVQQYPKFSLGLILAVVGAGIYLFKRK